MRNKSLNPWHAIFYLNREIVLMLGTEVMVSSLRLFPLVIRGLLESHLGIFTAFSVKRPCGASFLTNSDLVLTREASCTDSLLPSELCVTRQYNTCLLWVSLYSKRLRWWKTRTLKAGGIDAFVAVYKTRSTGYSSWKPQTPVQNSIDA